MYNAVVYFNHMAKNSYIFQSLIHLKFTSRKKRQHLFKRKMNLSVDIVH